MSQNESTHNVGALKELYIDSTISSVLQTKYKAEIRKTISILRLIPPKKTLLIEKLIRHFQLHQHIQIL